MLDTETETALRRAFAKSTVGIEVPTAVTERLASHDYHPRSGHRGVAATALASVVAVGTGVPVALHALGPGPAGLSANQGTVLRLASYSLRLPDGYHQASSVPPKCSRYSVLPEGASGGPTRLPQPAIGSAVAQAGGCLVFALGALSQAGPQAGPSAAIVLPRFVTQPVTIDGYQGWVGAPEPGTAELDLTVPVSNGRAQQLMFMAVGVTPATLVQIVSSGLTSMKAPPATSAPATSAPAAATTTAPVASTTVPAATTTSA